MNSIFLIIQKVLSLICSILGYFILKNSASNGYETLGLYLSNSGNSGTDPNVYNALLNSFILSYQITGAILLAVGIYHFLKFNNSLSK
ncbi:hypothetical protein [Paenibacillus humicola]|uniref:hypothetical protein n=1 Tax=Paenibacillus humicola TaxID=3110540 RepID=UPI00237B8A8C|nr:hypothetical protein [Paenibacillus humicola]